MNPGENESFGYFDSVQPVLTAYSDINEVSVPPDSVIKVILPYDRFSGPRWRIRVTEGLFVEKERYLPYPEGVVAPTDGVMEWYVRSTGSGDQTFMALSRIPFSARSPVQTRYTLLVHILT